MTNQNNGGVDMPYPLHITCPDPFNGASDGNGKFGSSMGGIRVPELVIAVFDRRHYRKHWL